MWEEPDGTRNGYYVIDSVYSLPENYLYLDDTEDMAAWDDIFNQYEDDELFASSTELFMMKDKYDRYFFAIGYVLFYKDSDLTKLDHSSTWEFHGVAIAPSDYLEDDDTYLTGKIYATPVAWTPLDWSPKFWKD